jgi:hypothetical protein
MKLLKVLSAGLLVVSAASVQAQTQPQTSPAAVDAPTVTVTRINWRQDVFIPALYEDPMRINQDRDDLVRDQKAQALSNIERAKQGQTPIPQPTKKVAANIPVGSTPIGVPLGDEPAGNRNLPAQTDPGASTLHYVYEAKIQNTGEKTIRTIVWRYLVFDPVTEAEVGRHVFTGKVNIRAGKTANLVARSRTPPTRIVEATKSSQELRDNHSERVVIDRIEYDDGSFWQRPPG